MLVGFNVLFYIALFSLAPSVQLSDEFCSERHKLYKENKADVLAPCITALLAHNNNFYLAAGQQRLVYRYEGVQPHATGKLRPVAVVDHIEHVPLEVDQALLGSTPESSKKSSATSNAVKSSSVLISGEQFVDKLNGAINLPAKDQKSKQSTTDTTSVSASGSPTVSDISSKTHANRQWQFVEKQGDKISSYLWIEKKACIKDEIDFALTITFKINEQTLHGCGHTLPGPVDF